MRSSSAAALRGGQLALLGKLRELLHQLAHGLLVLLLELLPQLIVGLPILGIRIIGSQRL